ncbi:RagB/SusD family nutrient uptake outer membrane protein [Bacteroides sp.]|uniref:RagB/SusD family nutrient uptake outer membrane protein n=1 Tax=Bacteroides sp. TaxID=29523 RepID=UPI0025BB1F68|nr:RagB/SusD family nutrient uptake outer membrane protein [Bacteroides sp.]
MRKINYILFTAALLICSACDMNKMPEGSLSGDIVFTMQDCRSYHIGLYGTFRALTTGGFVTYGEIQTDNFHAVSEYTGELNVLYTGDITPGAESVTAIWAGNYETIGQANYYIKKLDELIASGSITASENLELKRYMAEAFFTRAYCYFNLTQKFCQRYDPGTASQDHSGLPLVTKYNPSSDNTQYPDRMTLEETYKLILGDLSQSLEEMTAFDEKNPDANPSGALTPWITTDVVKALQARVALVMGDYETALKKSEGIINSSRYNLTNNETNLYNFWSVDYGAAETLWLVTMTRDYTGYSTGSPFLANTGAVISFIPTNDVATLYSDKDIRAKAYLGSRAIRVSAGSETVSALTKYPGNPYLYYNINTFCNMSKPFRIAEQYLIAAESAAKQDLISKSNLYLNELKKNRITGYESKQLAGDNLMKEIKAERRRELLCEGFRLSDLKRWHEGFERSEGQKTGTVINKLGNVHRLKYDADDYRLVWPIPQEEIDANPQIKSQQNPGY